MNEETVDGVDGHRPPKDKTGTAPLIGFTLRLSENHPVQCTLSLVGDDQADGEHAWMSADEGSFVRLDTCR